jgi:CDP-diacylglycerol--serine O-phosphatidyltransferase
LERFFGIFKLGKHVKKIRPSVYAPVKVIDHDLIEEEDESESEFKPTKEAPKGMG